MIADASSNPFQSIPSLPCWYLYGVTSVCSLGGRLVGGRGSIGLHLGVLSRALIGHIGDIAAVAVDGVGHPLEATVGQGDKVGARGGVAVPVLVLAVVVVGGAVVDGPGVGVLRRHVGVGGGSAVGGGGAVGAGQGNGHQAGQGDNGL